MKKLLFAIFTLFAFSGVLNAQNPIVQNLLNDVRLDSLTQFVRQLTGQSTVTINGATDTIKSRHYQDPGNEKAFEFLKGQFIRYGYQVDSQQYSAKGKNLFAIKQGYKYPNRRFILGAHYDNLPAQSVAQGADDNASGSATVLEAGRIFRNYNFPYTIVFALWDEEEIGLIGSTAYVPTISNTNDTLMGYVNVDMLGWDGNNDSIADINTKNVAHSPAFADRSQYCNTAYNIRLNIHILNPGEESSDQAPFWNGNYTAIGIGEEHHTDFYPYWHTAGDSLSHFNLSFYQKCSKLAYATIADCAMDTLNIVGVDEIRMNSQFSIYPNPFASEFMIRSDASSNDTFRIVVSDAIGRVVYEATSFEASTVVYVPELLPGVYTIRLSSGNAFSVQKLVKK